MLARGTSYGRELRLTNLNKETVPQADQASLR